MSISLRWTGALLVLTLITVSAIPGEGQAAAGGQISLAFDVANYSEKTVTVDGQAVNYRSYEKIFYVSKPVDTSSQYLNVYVPEAAINNQVAPILFPNGINGYVFAVPIVPAANASIKYVVNKADPVPVTLAKGPANIVSVALAKGYVVATAGARGSNSIIDGQFIGKAPAAIVDLKSAVRYLRYNDAVMPGSAERIISDGTSAGGAMSALLGASGNDAMYKSYLAALGAASARDDIFATICFAPITDLDHSDMAYEWMYNRVNDRTDASGNSIYGFTEAQKSLSAELMALYPAYLNDLRLKSVLCGTLLTDANYIDYIATFFIASAQKALDRGASLSGISWLTVKNRRVTDFDFDAYLMSIGRQKTMKDPPAFDWLAGDPTTAPRNAGSRENKLFGTPTKDISIFTDYAAKRLGFAILPQDVKDRAYLMNAMSFVNKPGADNAPYWYIRHGSSDNGTAFSVPVNLYTALMNAGMNVNFGVAWEMPHSGDYDLEELFSWIDWVCGSP
jgi:acetyl esterase/lipase